MKLVFVPLKDVFKECKGKRQFSIKKDAYRRFSSVSNEMQIGIKKIAALYFTIKCLQNCPKVAMLYNSRKTGVQIGNQIVDIFQTNMQANQGPAKIDLALGANGGDMFWLIRQDQRFIPAPRVGHAE